MKTLCILAGGKSRRMGRDKVFLEIDGKTFLEYVLERAMLWFDHILISVDEMTRGEKITKLPTVRAALGEGRANIVADIKEGLGPLGGIISVFEQTDIPDFAIIPVDVPLADMEVLRALCDAASENPANALFLNIGAEKPEPLAAVYKRGVYPFVKEAAELGEYSVRKAIGADNIRVMGIDELSKLGIKRSEAELARAFANYNRPEDLEKL